MFTVIGIMLTGVIAGSLLRKQECLQHINKVITVLIWALLFILGVEVGGNERIINGLYTLGIEAIVLTVGGFLGSVLFAAALWRYVSFKKKGDKR